MGACEDAADGAEGLILSIMFGRSATGKKGRRSLDVSRSFVRNIFRPWKNRRGGRRSSAAAWRGEKLVPQ